MTIKTIINLIVSLRFITMQILNGSTDFTKNSGLKKLDDDSVAFLLDRFAHWGVKRNTRNNAYAQILLIQSATIQDNQSRSTGCAIVSNSASFEISCTTPPHSLSVENASVPLVHLSSLE
ncbi:Hypothetical_protein [Hexamita inflata]|uniref:Hypothetical_protein n=1 Tax=Hexamita inflata TaxID=28002 RepID=A0AA86TY04_9EUKA|nr:Hypothetical protein HINF_LOCUS20251 [Hexamita inflata]